LSCRSFNRISTACKPCRRDSAKFDLGGPEKQQILDLGRLNFTHHKYMLGVYSHIVLFVIGYLASFLFRADKDTKDLTLYGWLAKR